jgi:hypothetical protein
MTTAKKILAAAEQRMTIQTDNGTTPARRAEITYIVDFMASHNFEEAPPDADPVLVALIRMLNDSV